MLVQVNNTAHRATIVLKATMPICVFEHDIRSAVRALLIGAVEEAAHIRLNAQRVEVVPAHFKAPDLGWIFARVFPDIEPYRNGAKRCQTVKAAVAIAQVDIVGVRLPKGFIAPALNCVEALRLRHTQRAQDQRIQYAKNNGVRAYRQRQRQNGDDCESGRLAQHPKTEAHILYQSLDKIAAERFSAFLFEPPMAAELDARAVFRIGTRQPGALQIVSAVLDV